MRTLLICALLVAVAPGCDNKKKEDSESSESPAKKKEKKPKDDEAADDACKDGTDDPSNDDFAAIVKGEADYKKLAKKYPASARVHVAGGRAAIIEKPPRHKDAYAAYTKALALFDGGCKLSAQDQWDAMHGAGLAALVTEQVPESVKLFQRAAKKWPDISTTRYNLACAHCRNDDVDACYDELKAALAAAEAGKEAPFIKGGKDAKFYADLARKDDDLKLLRKDKRFDKLVSKYE